MGAAGRAARHRLRHAHRLRRPRRAEGPHPGGPGLLPEARHLAVARRPRRAARGRRDPRLRGRDRAGDRQPVRRVGEAAAWAAVAAVTAANDLGVYDLRWRTRAPTCAPRAATASPRSGPGCCPPRSSTRPPSAHARLAQRRAGAGRHHRRRCCSRSPSSSADLSQLITLEPGDVILTGTPAGASTFGPGDVVEVEVEAAGRSTGRLVSTAVRGTAPFARLQRAAQGRPPAAGGSLRARATRRTRASTTSWLRERGQRGRARHPVVAAAQARPEQRHHRRAALHPTRHPARRHRAHAALRAQPRGPLRAPTAAATTRRSGVRRRRRGRGDRHGGPRRDRRGHARRHPRPPRPGSAGPRASSPTAACATPTPSPPSASRPTSRTRTRPCSAASTCRGTSDVTIACGGTTVQPGDIIVGDADGVLVIPPGARRGGRRRRIAQEDEEAFIAEMVREGHPVRRPLPDERRVAGPVRGASGSHD